MADLGPDEKPVEKLFGVPCDKEKAFIEYHFIRKNGLVNEEEENKREVMIKIKTMMNIMLENLMTILKDKKKFDRDEDYYLCFLSDNINSEVGNIGIESPKENWEYLIRDPRSNPYEPTCREKITALHHFVYNKEGGLAMFKFVMEMTNFEENPFVEKRQNQIKQLFKIYDIEKLKNLAIEEDNWRVRIAWSPTDYFYPSLALRRLVISDLRNDQRRKFIEKIPNTIDEFTNNIMRSLIELKKEKPQESANISCDYPLTIFNEPFSKLEKELIIKRLRKDLKIEEVESDEVVLSKYKFKVGACYDTKTRGINPKNYFNSVKGGKCRVVGYSGSAALLLDICLLLNLNWKPLYLGLLIDYVPIHHSIGEIFDVLIDFGFITETDYINQESTILKHKDDVMKMEDFNLNYKDFIDKSNFGYKTTFSTVGGKRKTMKNKQLKRKTMKNKQLKRKKNAH